MGQSRISFQVIMNSMKVTICLLVIGQLQPAIARIVASTLGGVGQGAVQATSFGQGAGGFSQGNSFRGGSSVGSNGFSQGSSFGGSSSGSSSLSASRLTSNVVTALQPQIAAAVAQALRSSQAGPVRGGAAGGAALSEEEEAEYNRKLSANAQYEFGYKVADDDKQTYMAHEETRNGEAVQGKYSYVDPAGALVTSTMKLDQWATLRQGMCRRMQCKLMQETLHSLGLVLLLVLLLHHRHLRHHLEQCLHHPQACHSLNLLSKFSEQSNLRLTVQYRQPLAQDQVLQLVPSTEEPPHACPQQTYNLVPAVVSTPNLT